ncbi:hypothetical protein VNO80_06809 [Phaseolus coccineus]|uniref:Uncharacterized protein n=1 Tax=Phaseolus coccineus TaxID=3886 RepID=A0AAN9NMB1_PHACN
MYRFSPPPSTSVIPIVFTPCLAFSRARSTAGSTSPKWHFQQQLRDEEVEERKREQEKEHARRDRLYHMNRSNPDAPHREATIPFSIFSKLSFIVPELEDLILCGALKYYDRSYDRITPKNERHLECFKNRNFFKVSTTDDPVIRKLANEDKATMKEKWNRLSVAEQAWLKARQGVKTVPHKAFSLPHKQHLTP